MERDIPVYYGLVCRSQRCDIHEASTRCGANQADLSVTHHVAASRCLSHGSMRGENVPFRAQHANAVMTERIPL
jgi:hypothetical protein